MKLAKIAGVLLPVCMTITLAACGKKEEAKAEKTAPVKAEADAKAQAANDAKVKEAVEIATDAYVYGYSLITTDVTRIQMTNTDKVEGLRGPANQFINVKRYPPADYRGVSAPNADTLYSAAWIDLSEPQVFSHPDMGKRYFLFPMYDL